MGVLRIFVGFVPLLIWLLWKGASRTVRAVRTRVVRYSGGPYRSGKGTCPSKVQHCTGPGSDGPACYSCWKRQPARAAYVTRGLDEDTRMVNRLQFLEDEVKDLRAVKADLRRLNRFFYACIRRIALKVGFVNADPLSETVEYAVGNMVEQFNLCIRDGHRLLWRDEGVLEGDERWCGKATKAWEPVPAYLLGRMAFQVGDVRRPIGATRPKVSPCPEPESVSNSSTSCTSDQSTGSGTGGGSSRDESMAASLNSGPMTSKKKPDPGLGWRLLDLERDAIMEGDEWYAGADRWTSAPQCGAPRAWYYRRRLPPVGDGYVEVAPEDTQEGDELIPWVRDNPLGQPNGFPAVWEEIWYPGMAQYEQQRYRGYRDPVRIRVRRKVTP